MYFSRCSAESAGNRDDVLERIYGFVFRIKCRLETCRVIGNFEYPGLRSAWRKQDAVGFESIKESQMFFSIRESVKRTETGGQFLEQTKSWELWKFCFKIHFCLRDYLISAANSNSHFSNLFYHSYLLFKRNAVYIIALRWKIIKHWCWKFEFGILYIKWFTKTIILGDTKVFKKNDILKLYTIIMLLHTESFET